MRLGRYILTLIVLLIGSFSFANIRPANGAMLNYTQVMFEFNEVPGSDLYVLTVTSSVTGTSLEFQSRTLAILVKEGFRFGDNYHWHYKALKKGASLFTSQEYFFSIKASFQTDGYYYRHELTKAEKGKYQDGIIFLDYMGMAINRRGEPVWFMPVLVDSLESLKMRNFKLSPAGTITYLDNSNCFERDLNSNIIWRGPNNGQLSGDATEYYHHDFEKMDDGTFVVAGYKYLHQPNYFDSSVLSRVRYNTVLQYDNTGKLIWFWDESKHVDKKTIFSGVDPKSIEVEGTHLNGFAYDKSDLSFILSFRNNSSILKIDKKTGNIVYDLAKSIETTKKGSKLFSLQHSPVILTDGRLMIYNNNVMNNPNGISYPTVQIYTQPKGKLASKKVWEYECASDRFPKGIRGKEGHAAQLPNKNILVCMGGANFIFEISPDKKKIWECFFEKFDAASSEWRPLQNYRCSFSTSLFPRYFTIQDAHIFMNKVTKTRTASVKINNNGTDDDTYVVELRSGGNLSNKKITIKANHSQLMNFQLPNNLKGEFIILVYPAREMSLSRSVTLSAD